MIEINKIYNENCLELLKRLDDKSIDLIVTDPPYGIKINKMSFVTTGAIKPSKNAKAKRTDFRKMAEWDKERIGKEYFDEMFRVSKNQIIFGGNYYTDILPPTKSWIIWDKRTQDKYRNDFADCEMAWCSTGVARVFRWLWSGMIQQDMKNKEKRYHPTQKPVGMFKQIIEKYSKEGDLILDPFVGCGSTCIASRILNRNYIGVDLSADYCRIAEERLKEYESRESTIDVNEARTI